MGLLDIFRGKSVSDVPSPSGKPTAAYFRGGRNLNLNSWRPSLRSAQSDIAVAWDVSAARTVDAMHNSGWLTGALEQSTANVVGMGMRLKPSPESELLGWDKSQTREWVKLVERRWELWANNPLECDIEGKRTFGEIQRDAYGSWMATGEILAESLYRMRPWNQNGTKVRLLSPTRLSRRSSITENLINGVYLDGDGMAVGYAVKASDREFAPFGDRRVQARDVYGRPRVIHIFNGPPETCRGISPLAPVLQVIRQFDQLSDATLMAAIVQTLFAATIVSGDNTEEAIEGLLTDRELADMKREGIPATSAYLDMTAGYYEGSPLDIGVNGRVSHMFPGDKFEFQTASHPNGNYPDFQKVLMREIARCFGLTYESATGDYHGATYASLGRAIAEIHEITKARRGSIVAPLCQPAYEAWLEEEIDLGRIPFPGGVEGFLNNRHAVSRAIWRGGPKPIAEELKLAKAHDAWLRLGVMSEQMACADLGVDYEDVLQERSEAEALREEYGLPAPVFGGLGGSSQQAQPEDDQEDEDA